MSVQAPADLRVVSNLVDNARFNGVNIGNMLSGLNGTRLDLPPVAQVSPAVAAQLKETARKVGQVRRADTDVSGVTRTAQLDTRFRPPVVAAGVTPSLIPVDEAATRPKAPPAAPIRGPKRDF